MLRRSLAFLFLLLIFSAILQCGRRGTLTGGPKDIKPPTLIKSDPPNMSVNFKANKIRLTFDEYVKLQDVQNQLIVSPPLKYLPEITPQGGASKFVEIKIKDTLKENTTYTFNFGQSVQDNNEGNPSSFLTYVFSTGDYIDSLQVRGVVKDAFNKKADAFISVMLYEIDSAYTDSTLFKKLPNYITNTLDSTVIFTLANIKEGKYALFAMKDEAKNNLFDQNSDKIAFIKDTVSLPTDSTYLLRLFKEVPNYSVSVPSFAARNKIVFGYYGADEDLEIKPLTTIADSVKTKILRDGEKDTLNFWFTPFEFDSIVFTVTNEKWKVIDTFSVKKRKVGLDSLQLTANQRGTLSFNEAFHIAANTPLFAIDTTLMKMMGKDSIPMNVGVSLDSIGNKVDFEFSIEPDENYSLELLPGAITDFFGETNDTLNLKLSTRNYADYGNLTMNIEGAVEYPILVQLTSEDGKKYLEVYGKEEQAFEFSNIEPGTYLVRVIQDANGNGKWDTGNYLKNLQPEKVSYYPDKIEVRANWEKIETFRLVE
ncbi:MAG: Ig-like domain-containing protein [Flavobacteriaceae bacterium]